MPGSSSEISYCAGMSLWSNAFRVGLVGVGGADEAGLGGPPAMSGCFVLSSFAGGPWVRVERWARVWV